MQLFSIQQTTLDAVFTTVDGEVAGSTRILLSHDPDDSSKVRMRVEPYLADGMDPAETNAVEIIFARGGREVERHCQPMDLPAWDRRDPGVIRKEMDAAIDAALTAAAIDAANEATDAASTPVPTNGSKRKK